MNYKNKLLDPRWQKIRLQVFERDNWTCQDCKSKKKTLHVHHTEYLPNTEPWDAPLDSLITKCYKCHKDEHKDNSSVLEEIDELLRFRISVWEQMEESKENNDAILSITIDKYNFVTNKIRTAMAELKNGK